MSATRRLVVEADGGSRGNPGPAGYGAVVRDADTAEVLAERAEGIGRATNNVAEYRGLIAGLEAALELPAESVEVRMDSKLVVEQMSGRWKIKHPDMRPLALRAQRLAGQLRGVSFTWIPRERNGYADRLANEAMDRAAAGLTWEPSPVAKSVPIATWTPRTGGTSTWLLRHGQTEHSIDRRFSGRNDLPLTAEGEKQSLAAATRLTRAADLVAVVTSPLRRARQTADLVADALDLPVTEDEDLVETDFGSWEGRTLTEVSEAHPAEWAAWIGSVDVAPPGGERFSQVARRVRRARTRILARHAGQAVLVVTHVTPIKLMIQAGLDAPMSVLFRLHLDPAGLSTVDWYADGQASVSLLNDTSHLL